MRFWITLCENGGTRTLYLGDVTKIDTLDSEATRHSIGLLFGMGIYLTDQETVALDYTIPNKLSYPNKNAAINSYIYSLIKNAGWEDKLRELKDEWSSKLWNDPDAENKFKDIMSNELKRFIINAKLIYKNDPPQLYCNSKNEWSIVPSNHQGALSVFEIPESYLLRTLHGDRPLTNSEIKIVRDFIYTISPSGMMDVRNRNNERISSFDEWLDEFKSNGSLYAWQDRDIGGRGLNPSLDELINGTYGGYNIFRNNIDKFITYMRNHGYVGIEFDGGIKMGDNIRGQGGIRHQSFVFWDDAYINQQRVDNRFVDYDISDVPNRSIRTSSVLKAIKQP